MIQPINASFPGDGVPGMLIPNKNGTDITWELDETFRLECVKGMLYCSTPFFTALCVSQL